MARALCELQLELQTKSSSELIDQPANVNASTNKKREQNDTDNKFIPNTPAGKESNRKKRASKVSTSLEIKFMETKTHLEDDANLKMRSGHTRIEKFRSMNGLEGDSCASCKSCHMSNMSHEVDSCAPAGLQSHQGTQNCMGDFPSPTELANLDERFLAKRCNLGYRAGRIIKLAQGIVDGRIQLRELEEACIDGVSLSSYDKLFNQLRQIDGFGPFTCANVLMCMGFYHVIPTDSETVRHLKQVIFCFLSQSFLTVEYMLPMSDGCGYRCMPKNPLFEQFKGMLRRFMDNTGHSSF